MEEQIKLYLVMLGCTVKGRLIEQHDIFFGIGNSLSQLVPKIKEFWPDANTDIHIDVWREVTAVDNFLISVVPKNDVLEPDVNSPKLFFLNLGGYKQNEFEEYHYKMLTVADTIADAIKKSKKSAFYKHFGFKGAVSHIDEKYGIDVDDLHNVSDILSPADQDMYSIKITAYNEIFVKQDEFHNGYLKLNKIPK
ncbi:DUF1543 domain-containing protein [Flavobacterium sp.]|uniref:DUF1543 domain-containing protein n=1 Tax=Flavobacterium sp. TaxID=239 RepID=UPI003263B430